MNAVVRNLYFKLSANNITFSILEKFFLEKIDSNIKANISFLYLLIQEAVGIKIINIANFDSNTFATIPSTINSEENLYF